MEKDLLKIKRVTLQKIGNAIRIFHAKRSHTIQGNIPVREFAKALRDGKVETTAPLATEEEYLIQSKTLTDVADVVRDIGGATSEILVKDLEGRIINLIVNLSTPIIEIVEEEGDGDIGEEPTIPPLKKPTIKIVKVDSDVEEEEEPKPVALDAPKIVIEYVDSDADIEEEPIIQPLDKPNISIVKVEQEEEEKPDEGIKSLSTPQIAIVKVDSETGGDIEPEIAHLDKPSIKIEKVVDDVVEEPPVITPLGKPIIAVIKVSTDIEEEEKPEISALKSPEIRIEISETETDKEPEIVITSLMQPKITIEEIEEEDYEEPSPMIPELRHPEILIEIDYAQDEEEEVPTIANLKEPSIEIVQIIDIAKMPFNNYGIIDYNGRVLDSHTYAGKAHSNIVAIKDLVNGPDGYCVQDFDILFTEYPKVLFFFAPHLRAFVNSLNVTDIGNKDALTVEEIKYYADTFADGAEYVAFNSDFEDEPAEDFAYIIANAETYDTTEAKGVLKTPTITLVPVEVGVEEEPAPVITQLAQPKIQIFVEKPDDDTTAILGKAILGKAILGNSGI